MELTNPTGTPLPSWASELIPDLHDAIWSGGGHHDHAAWCALEVLQRRGLLVQSEPEGVTDEELLKMAAKELGYEFSPKWFLTGKNCPSLETDPYELLGFARAVFARYARPTIEPVPVAERLPEAGDCDAEGRCWWGVAQTNVTQMHWIYRKKKRWDDGATTHWLPHHALPLPQQPH
jgi:hypothetical protein